MERKILRHKVTVMQGSKQAVFNLSDKELDMLRKASVSSRDEKVLYHGRCYNFAMFAFFDYDTSRSKAGRFNSIFNYHEGDFNWFYGDMKE